MSIAPRRWKRIRKWLKFRVPPERRATAPKPCSPNYFLDYLSGRWAEGCVRGRELLYEIKLRGYTGSFSHLERLLTKWRRANDAKVVAEDAAASLKTSESPETRGTPETSSATDIAVAFAALGTQKGPLELAAEAPASDELRQNRDERPAVDLPERNPRLVEPAAARARVEKMARYTGLAGEHDRRWWRRLVGWIRTRRGREARKRLRERL